MSKFLNIFAPSAGGAAVVLLSAYTLADQFVVDMPAPMRDRIVTAANAAGDATTTEPAAETAAAPVIMAAATGQGDPMPQSVSLRLGRPATADEVAAWDIDIRPDGQGLPEGRGDVFTGEELYTDNCAMCHGDFGEAVDRWPVLAGGQGSLTDDRPVKTIGSYWPYLSTVWDYVHRAMPFGNAQSLSDDDVYAITAYLLYLNDLVDDDFELSHENFSEVRLPNEENFFLDDRADAELAAFSGEVCMENCKETAEISARAQVVDVTPDDAAARQRREAAAAASGATAAPAAEETEETVEVAAAEEAPAEEVAASDGPDPALVAAGEKAFKKCASCHQVGEGAKNRSGPVLNGIVGHSAGAVDGFKYSSAMTKAADGGLVWSEDELAAFLTKPRDYLKGTKMSFAGFRSEDDIAAVIAYLKTFE